MCTNSLHSLQADIVTELTWVDGLGNIHKDSRDSDAGRALVGGLGVAGLVTELLLQLEAPSVTAVETRFKKHDGKLYDDVMDMLKVRRAVLKRMTWQQMRASATVLPWFRYQLQTASKSFYSPRGSTEGWLALTGT